jgi:hypothetical protein
VPSSGQDVIMKRYAHLATPRNRRFFQALAGKRTLDVGCAHGGFLVAMAVRGASRERDADRRAFLRRYGVGFSCVVARKRGRVPPGSDASEPAPPAAPAH